MSPILYANIALSMYKYSWKKYNNMFLSVIFSSVGPRVGLYLDSTCSTVTGQNGT